MSVAFGVFFEILPVLGKRYQKQRGDPMNMRTLTVFIVAVFFFLNGSVVFAEDAEPEEKDPPSLEEIDNAAFRYLETGHKLLVEGAGKQFYGTLVKSSGKAYREHCEKFEELPSRKISVRLPGGTFLLEGEMAERNGITSIRIKKRKIFLFQRKECYRNGGNGTLSDGRRVLHVTFSTANLCVNECAQSKKDRERWHQEKLEAQKQLSAQGGKR